MTAPSDRHKPAAQTKSPAAQQMTLSRGATAAAKDMAMSKHFCCTDNMLLLPISGSFVGLLGLVLLILYLVARGLTTSLYLVEGTVPSYAVAAMLMLTGMCVILLVKFRYVALNSFALLMCLATFTLCIVSVISTAIISIPFLERFSTCIPRPSLAQCQCYILAEQQNNNSTNNGIFVPGVDSKTYTFYGARTCLNVERTLKDFLYAMSVIYGFAAIACLFSGTLSLLWLCTRRNYTKKLVDADGTVSSRSRGRRTSQNSESRQPLNTNQPTQSGRPAAIATVTTESGSAQQGQRSSHTQNGSSNARPPASRGGGQPSRGHQVHRSSSMSHNNSPSPATQRQVRRHNSAAAADTPPNRTAQQRRPPPLIRGGFLQSSVNGPSVPVYTVPGSNEAYIALTDLPSLQMPSMDDVPAYVSDIQDPFPMDEPPPYTPSAEGHPFFPPPAFTPSAQMPDIAEGTSPEPINSADNLAPSQPPPPSAVVTMETVQHVLGVSPTHTPRSDTEDTNNLNQDGSQALPSTVDTQQVVPTISGANPQQGYNALPPSVSNAQGNARGHLYDQVRSDTALDGRVVQSALDSTRVAGTESQSRSASRSRENTPTRHGGRQEPVAQSLSISEGVARIGAAPTNAQLMDPRTTGARPKNGSYNALSRPSGGGGGHRGQQSRSEPHYNMNGNHGQNGGGGAKKKRPQSPIKSNNNKGKQRSQADSRSRVLPDIASGNGGMLPDSEIRATPKKSSKKTDHRSKVGNRSTERKQTAEGGAKRQKSHSPDKRRKKENKSPSRLPETKHKSKKKMGGASKSGPLRLNIPNDSSSDEETMNGIMDLVESVHTPRRGQKSKEQKRSAKGKGKKGLLDSRV